MSKKQTIVVVEPGSRVHSEAFVTSPVTCPYCKGRGFFMEPLLPFIETPKSCPDCKGSGQVMAVVEIKWMPHKNNRYETASN